MDSSVFLLFGAPFPFIPRSFQDTFLILGSLKTYRWYWLLIVADFFPFIGLAMQWAFSMWIFISLRSWKCSCIICLIISSFVFFSFSGTFLHVEIEGHCSHWLWCWAMNWKIWLAQLLCTLGIREVDGGRDQNRQRSSFILGNSLNQGKEVGIPELGVVEKQKLLIDGFWASI